MGAHIAQFGGDAVDFLRKQRCIAFHRHLVEPNVAGMLRRNHAHLIVAGKGGQTCVKERLHRVVSKHIPFHIASTISISPTSL